MRPWARSVVVIAAAVAGCGDPAPTRPDAPGPPDAAPDAERRLGGTPGRYRETCDGSGAVAIDDDHFVDAYDEDQVLRIYARGGDAPPVQTIDIGAGLGVGPAEEADLEELVRRGDRIYAITSHGRDTAGVLRPPRYRFAALDVTGAVPALAITVAGSASTLLADLIDPANWDAPDTGVIATLADSSQLGDPTDPDLAPELGGTNLEGLALDPAPDNPGRMVIGFRNPLPAGRAIVVTLENPDAVIAGAPARFGDATLFDLDGLGIRAMAWSEAHAAILIVAGPAGAGGPFRLYRWSGALADAPALVGPIDAPPASAPEAIVPYPWTRDVQITFDQGDADAGGTPCKLAAPADRVFTDVIVRVE